MKKRNYPILFHNNYPKNDRAIIALALGFVGLLLIILCSVIDQYFHFSKIILPSLILIWFISMGIWGLWKRYIVSFSWGAIYLAHKDYDVIMWSFLYFGSALLVFLHIIKLL